MSVLERNIKRMNGTLPDLRMLSLEVCGKARDVNQLLEKYTQVAFLPTAFSYRSSRAGVGSSSSPPPTKTPCSNFPAGTVKAKLEAACGSLPRQDASVTSVSISAKDRFIMDLKDSGFGVS
jgi:hypothetical protein